MKKICKFLIVTLLSIFIFNTDNIKVNAETKDNIHLIVEKETSDNYHLLDDKIENINGCESIFGDPDVSNPATPAYYMSFAFSIMRYAAIVILIVMTITDFLGALSAQDNDIMRKAIRKLGSRAVMCVVIFLLPTLIDFVLKFLHNSQVSDCIDLTK